MRHVSIVLPVCCFFTILLVSPYITNNEPFDSLSALIGELYSQHKDEDGFIYIMYSGENTFGIANNNNNNNNKREEKTDSTYLTNCSYGNFNLPVTIATASVSCYVTRCSCSIGHNDNNR